ncbi:MAG: hypothetical protein CMI21_06550 [Opitutae bacterium]|nr:hypothetical protein [Opitutae bacterium]
METNEFREFCRARPDKQNILDVFKGKWICEVPVESGLSTGGKVHAFEDARIEWLLDAYGEARGKSILELGPFEGGHTYMLSKLDPSLIISIEANVSCFLKCLCIKEAFDLRNVEFRLGDFNEYLPTCERRFDLVVASGVLYHSSDPMALLESVCRVSDNLFIWTHYADPDRMETNPNLKKKFGPLQGGSFGGLDYEFFEQTYQYGVTDEEFCGGTGKTSRWLTKDAIVSALRHFGHKEVRYGPDDVNHPNGPSACLFSRRS